MDTNSRFLCTLAVAFAAQTSVAGACPAAPLSPNSELYPSAAFLPENILRFYLYFPRSVGSGFDVNDIKLVDENGLDVQQVFLPMRFDLWSSDRRRLTLLLDPGRVKSGLNAHERLGRVLFPGETYSLQIPGHLVDQAGCSLGNATSFSFTAIAADKDPPTPSNWILDVPSASSTSVLRVDLDSSHDHLSMAYRIRVVSKDGEAVAGKISLSDEERIWEFTPNEDWQHSVYKLIVDPQLEDLAGNRPGVLFDRSIETDREVPTTVLRFTPE